MTETGLPTVLLGRGEAERVIAGHPWIYASSIERITGTPNDGDLVEVKDSRRKSLGIGFFNSRSKIQVRLISDEPLHIDQAWFERRLQAAATHRARMMPGATSYRLVNAESDFLSGLIVDRYEDVLVLQTTSLGMDQRKEMIVAALEKLFHPRAIVEKNDAAFRKFEGMEEAKGVLRGEVNGPVPVKMNGLTLQVDLIGGHKTGMYLDQQLNYERVTHFAKGAVVLDCFSFLGGFALHAARAGARKVHALDQSAEAVKAAQLHAEQNGLADKCAFEVANVFDWLKAKTHTPPNEKLIPQFDLIILDPPSFTRTRAAVGDALRGYKEIHLRALKLLRRGGVLATFCCSHHVDADLFQQVILEAAFDAKKVLRRLESYSQSPDHPIVPTIQESEYLKGFAFELAR